MNDPPWDDAQADPASAAALRVQSVTVVSLALIFYFNFQARFIWGPLLVAIETEMGLGHTQAGAFFLLTTCGYFGGLFLSGHLSFRLNHQKTIALSSMTCGLALAAATAVSSPAGLMTVLVVIGVAAGLYLPSGIASLTYGLKARNFGLAFSVHEMAPSLAFVTGPLLAEWIMGWASWRVVLWPLAVGQIGMGLLYALRSSTAGFRGEAPTLGNMRRVVARRVFWLMLVFFVLCIGANVGVYAMLPLYLQVERGLDQTATNFILSASRVAAMFSPFAAGWATRRWGPRAVVAVDVLSLGVATVLLGAVSNRWLWLPLFLQPLLATAFFPPAYAIVTAAVPAGLRSLVIALIMPVAMVLGSGALPTLIGAFGDAHRFYLGFLLTGALLAASTVLLRFVVVPQEPS